MKPEIHSGIIFRSSCFMPSSVIARYHYDPARQILTIVYQSGMVYDYLDVPESVYAAMKKVKSKGTFLNKEIKGKYEFKQVQSS